MDVQILSIKNCQDFKEFGWLSIGQPKEKMRLSSKVFGLLLQMDRIQITGLPFFFYLVHRATERAYEGCPPANLVITDDCKNRTLESACKSNDDGCNNISKRHYDPRET